jgi:hypothetical protein
MTVVLHVAADGGQSVLRVRPWLAADMPDLLAAMADEYPAQGLWSPPDRVYLGRQGWSGPRSAEEADLWLSSPPHWFTDGAIHVAEATARGYL